LPGDPCSDLASFLGEKYPGCTNGLFPASFESEEEEELPRKGLRNIPPLELLLELEEGENDGEEGPEEELEYGEWQGEV